MTDEGTDSITLTFNFPKCKDTSVQNVHSNRRKVKVMKQVRNGAHAKEGCDWLANTSWPANQRHDKRKFEGDGDGDTRTKKRRPGQ